MTLPASRNTTYAPGSQVKSADLNDLQDEIIDGYGRVGGEREMWMDAAMMVSAGSAAALGVDDSTGVVAWTYASGNRVACAIPGLRQSERIKAIKVRANSTGGSGNLDTKLWKRTSTSAPAQVGSTLGHSNTTTDQTHTLASPETVDAGESFLLTIRCTAGTPILYAVCIVVERMPV